MKKFITRRSEGQGKTKKERKATKSKGRGYTPKGRAGVKIMESCPLQTFLYCVMDWLACRAERVTGLSDNVSCCEPCNPGTGRAWLVADESEREDPSADLELV